MYRLFRSALLASALAGLALSLPASDAFAKQWKVHSQGGHMSGYRGYSHPAASSGVMLGHSRHSRSAAATVRYSTKRGHFRQARHHRRNGPLVIIIGANGVGDEYPDYRNGATSGTIPVLEGGSCKDNEYCSIRLGNATNAPKIITLNTSGRTITNEDVSAQ
ncbi:MAG: hypothetical protein KDJ48_14325 [Nitratireductor sp.]|nr:hypothetical protein [Nitratireductor sp.]MCB1460409.1 hypothetical protein [Nitratireductor sp.]